MSKSSSTTNYAMFTVSKENRDVDPKHLRKLKPSMVAYGWIEAFPMLVKKTKLGLEIVDGQHRFFIAQELGIEVWYKVDAEDYDVARINAGQVPWNTRNYAESYAKRGHPEYAEVLAFAGANRMSTSQAAALLAGQSNFSNVRDEWRTGKYKITDRDHAEKVAYLYTKIREIMHASVDKSLSLALIAIARVPEIDLQRLLHNAAQIPERFVKFGTRDGALAMLEFVYNYRTRGNRVALKVMAENVMHQRNATTH